MRFLYSFLYTCAFIIALPYFLVAGLFRGKYLSTIWQRLGNIPHRNQHPSIWIHAVSVGEFLACKTLIRKLQEMFPDVPVFVSTTTITGQKLARQLLSDSSFYFPFDWSWSVRKVFRRIRPKIVVVLETEIWPNFLWNARAAEIPTILINGRISDRSMSRYSRVKRWLPKFTENWMQTEKDAERMRSLGAESVFVMGNLKYDVQPAVASEELSKMLSVWKGADPVWIAGSSMAGEEQIILEVFGMLKNEHRLKLLLAPRHPERFSAVADLISDEGLTYARRSQKNLENAENADIFVLDTIGELAGAYQTADIVLIGGTLLENGGGHNPIEPAFFGKPIVSGPYFQNFRPVFEDFQRKNAILVTRDLLDDMRNLLMNPEKRSALGEAARTLVEENAGATKKVLAVVQRILERKSKHSNTRVLN